MPLWPVGRHLRSGRFLEYCIPEMTSAPVSFASLNPRPGETAVEPPSPTTRLALEPLASDSFKNKAYAALKNVIAGMDVYCNRLDIRLDERQLAQDFGASRTPVREAMAQLEREGFIRSVPRRAGDGARKTNREV